MSSIQMLFNRLHLQDDCTICLDTIKIENKSFIENCGHPFCFNCVLKWSNEKLTCPLCVGPFRNIIHNIISEKEYEIRDLIIDPAPSEETTQDPQSQLAGNVMPWYPLISHLLPSINFSLIPRTHELAQPIPYRRMIYTLDLQPDNVHLTTAGINLYTPGYYRDHRDTQIRMRTWIDRDLFILNRLLNPSRRRFDQVRLSNFIVNMLQYHEIQSDYLKYIMSKFLRHFTVPFIRELFEFTMSCMEVVEYDMASRYHAVRDTGD